MTMTAS